MEIGLWFFRPEVFGEGATLDDGDVRDHILDVETHDVTGARLALNRQIERRKVAPPLGHPANAHRTSFALDGLRINRRTANTEIGLK